MTIGQLAPTLPFSRRVLRPLAVAAAVAAGALTGASPARADVRLPAVLSDHMVLQQGANAPVWGWADAGEDVTVTFGDQKLSTKAGADGKWRVVLKPLTASDKPAELTVAGRNTIKLSDVLVGEVWVCSGQSNMEWSVAASKDKDKEIAAADFPNIRLLTVPRNVQEEPQHDAKAKWAACSPQTVGGFSGVGYFFGREVHKHLKVPVGLIHSSWGGTVAEAWADAPALTKDEEFASILKRAAELRDKAGYEKRLADWQAKADKAKAEKKPAPQGKPKDPASEPNRASVLYNGMISPIVGFAARGAIWYQGESNAGRAMQYRKLLPAMIGSWRDAWAKAGADGTFHFYIVQLANYQQVKDKPGDDAWAELREAQAMTAAMPNNGLAVAIDLADAHNPGDIHPRNKQDVGKRLALAALNGVYGKADVVGAGPTYASMKAADDGSVRVTFKNAEGLKTKDGSAAVKGFAVAGEDKAWHWAEAKIDGGSVVLKSDKVARPVAVRYAWAINPETNLYNAADLPAVPFRTDDWGAKK